MYHLISFIYFLAILSKQLEMDIFQSVPKEFEHKTMEIIILPEEMKT